MNAWHTDKDEIASLEGYRHGFYAMCSALGIDAKPYSPKEALERDILPRIAELIAAQNPSDASLPLLDAVCAELFERWDKDMRPGKLLLALGGKLPGYRNDIDIFRAAIRRATSA